MYSKLLAVIAIAVLVSGCGSGVTLGVGGANTPLGISPDSIILSPGQSCTFTATASNSFNTNPNVTFKWSGAAGGTLSPLEGKSTTFTAGTIPGDYELHLTRDDMPGKVGVAVITIQ